MCNYTITQLHNYTAFESGGCGMTVEEMIRRKRELGYSNEMIAKLSGVPLGTVQKVFGGATKAPRQKTLLALACAFDPDPAENRADIYESSSVREATLREAAPAYGSAAEVLPEKKQGEYTLEDYYAMPEERRVELIDGVIYDMTAPSYIHQMIIGEVFFQIKSCIEKHKVPCRVFFSPCDVQLDMDNRTMVQPDIIIVCNREKLKERVYFGAPDYVLEVLSPSTRKKDIGLKTQKYIEAGVREYWVIDPRTRGLMVYDLEGLGLPKVYGFDAKVPILISEGKCEIDFKVIDRIMDEMIRDDEEMRDVL